MLWIWQALGTPETSFMIAGNTNNSVKIMINADGTAGTVTNVIAHNSLHPYALTILDDYDTILYGLNDSYTTHKLKATKLSDSTIYDYAA